MVKLTRYLGIPLVLSCNFASVICSAISSSGLTFSRCFFVDFSFPLSLASIYFISTPLYLSLIFCSLFSYCSPSIFVSFLANFNNSFFGLLYHSCRHYSLSSTRKPNKQNSPKQKHSIFAIYLSLPSLNSDYKSIWFNTSILSWILLSLLITLQSFSHFYSLLLTVFFICLCIRSRSLFLLNSQQSNRYSIPVVCWNLMRLNWGSFQDLQCLLVFSFFICCQISQLIFFVSLMLVFYFIAFHQPYSYFIFLMSQYFCYSNDYYCSLALEVATSTNLLCSFFLFQNIIWLGLCLTKKCLMFWAIYRIEGCFNHVVDIFVR